ncbi:MAG: acyl-ACP thioesterase [Desulfuromonadales bacterium]|nr:acyl-ACP thioesterase [Desulfuromonadales bacterium]
MPKRLPSTIFEIEFPIRYHELDRHGLVRPVTLLNCVQNAGGLHAAQLGVSVRDLRKHGLTWVLSRVHLLVERYPHGDDVIQVRTWPSTREGLFSCREFEMRDKNGDVFSRATSSWAVLNLASRRPVTLPECLPEYPLTAQRAVDDDFASLPNFPDPPGETFSEHPFRVRRSDQDSNQHVNNTVYTDWALEAVPDDLAAGHLQSLEVSYRAEALYGERILSRCVVTRSGNDAECIHQILNSRDKRELARLRTRWKGAPP